MKKRQQTSLKKARDLAKKIAPQLKGGEIIGLVGALGSGKTAFAKALGKALLVKKVMPSPTFVLMHKYSARLPGSLKKIYLFHLDLYRLSNFKEVRALGIEEIWGKKNSITIIEWADKFSKKLPKKTKIIAFQG